MNQTPRSFFWVFSLSLAALSACTPSHTVKPVEDPKLLATALIFNYKLESEDLVVAEKGCQVTLEQLGGKNSKFDFRLPPDRNWVTFELPAGQYRPTDLYCTSHKKYRFYVNHFRVLTVLEGKLNLSAPYYFHIKRSAQELEGVRSHDGYRLQEMFQALAPADQGRLVSAATGRPITAATLQLTGRRFLCFTPKRRPKDRPRTRDCWDREAEQFGHGMGEYVVTAQYKKGEFVSSKTVKDFTTDSATFQACLQESLKKSSPSDRDQFELTLRIGAEECEKD